MSSFNNNDSMQKAYREKPQRRLYRKKRSDLRLFIEAIIMIFVGMSLVLFLNSIPEKFVWSDFINDTWTNLSVGLIQLFQALLQIGTATSVIFLLLLSIFLLIGGVTRILKLIPVIRSPFSINKNKRSTYKQ